MAASTRETNLTGINAEYYEAALLRLQNKLKPYKQDDRSVSDAHPAEDFFPTCAKIMALFIDSPTLLEYLKKLNQLLIAQKPHSLRRVLEKELTKFGFEPKFAKTYDLVDADVFRAALASGILIKDTSLLLNDHGELTHPIQWLLIAWHHEKTHFLGDQTVIDVYKQFGSDTSVICRFDKPDSLAGLKEITLWDWVVDNYSYQRVILKNPIPYSQTIWEGHFTSPNTINKFILLTQRAELSALKAAFFARHKKYKMHLIETSDAFMPTDLSDDFNPQDNKGRYHLGVNGLFFPKASALPSFQPPTVEQNTLTVSKSG